MNKSKMEIVIPEEVIINRILILRGEKVILDMHLAEIYGVENRALKQAVRRNIELFPDDFMFILTQKEVQEIVSQNVIQSISHSGGSTPYAFTETGVAMLSSVLKSKTAKEISIAIMRAFVALRRLLVGNKELRIEIENIKKKVVNHDKNIELIFQYLDELLEKKEHPVKRKQIGYKVDG